MLALTSLAHRDPPAHAAHVCGPYPADLPKATKKVSCSCVRLLATAESLTAVTQTSGQHELHTEIQTCQTGLLSLTFLAQMASAQADSQWLEAKNVREPFGIFRSQDGSTKGLQTQESSILLQSSVSEAHNHWLHSSMVQNQNLKPACT